MESPVSSFLRFSLLVLLASLFAGVILNAHAEEAAPGPSPLEETVLVCNSLEVYAQLAAQFRDQGMPLETAQQIARDSMQTNLATLPPEMYEPYVAVVMKLYTRVYADPSATIGTFDAAIFDACAGYRDYDLDRAALKAELARYVPSAFDRFQRVTLCVKAGETAANLVVARDQGMSRTQITQMASQALMDDPATAARLPLMVDEVYTHTALGAPTFYVYNIQRCEAEQAGVKPVALAGVAEAAAACEKEPADEVRGQCLLQLFTPAQ